MGKWWLAVVLLHYHPFDVSTTADSAQASCPGEWSQDEWECIYKTAQSVGSWRTRSVNTLRSKGLLGQAWNESLHHHQVVPQESLGWDVFIIWAFSLFENCNLCYCRQTFLCFRPNLECLFNTSWTLGSGWAICLSVVLMMLQGVIRSTAVPIGRVNKSIVSLWDRADCRINKQDRWRF